MCNTCKFWHNHIIANDYTSFPRIRWDTKIQRFQLDVIVDASWLYDDSTTDEHGTSSLWSSMLLLSVLGYICRSIAINLILCNSWNTCIFQSAAFSCEFSCLTWRGQPKGTPLFITAITRFLVGCDWNSGMIDCTNLFLTDWRDHNSWQNTLSYCEYSFSCDPSTILPLYGGAVEGSIKTKHTIIKKYKALHVFFVLFNSLKANSNITNLKMYFSTHIRTTILPFWYIVFLILSISIQSTLDQQLQSLP